jgi:exodeoxyribonuclease VII large subunit
MATPTQRKDLWSRERLCFTILCAMEKHIFSVTELNSLARQLLEGSLGQLWISGEISNLVHATSGHYYFSLKDAQAQVRCALFRMNGRRLPFPLKNGLQVLALAQTSLYEARGEFQLIIQQLEDSGVGLLQKKFEALKQRLHEAGLFAEANKKSLPFLPKTIGVITSPTGAAIHDILTVLKRRFPAIPVIIYPSLVQGEQAARKIAAALETANKRRECDVIILARGGGSLEDLWSFNEEIVARAIYASEIPVITGVGHEVDFTIADFVADVRAPTPSAAAERVSPDSREWIQQIESLQQRLLHLLVSRLRHAQSQLLHISKRLRHPGQRLQDQAQNLDQLEHRLILAQRRFFQHSHTLLNQAAQALQTLSPLKTLDRGYAIVRDNETQNIITSSQPLSAGDRLTIKFAQGGCECLVEKIIE